MIKARGEHASQFSTTAQWLIVKSTAGHYENALVLLTPVHIWPKGAFLLLTEGKRNYDPSVTVGGRAR